MHSILYSFSVPFPVHLSPLLQHCWLHMLEGDFTAAHLKPLPIVSFFFNMFLVQELVYRKFIDILSQVKADHHFACMLL